MMPATRCCSLSALSAQHVIVTSKLASIICLYRLLSATAQPSRVCRPMYNPYCDNRCYGKVLRNWGVMKRFNSSYTPWVKKNHVTKFLSIFSPNTDRFHWHRAVYMREHGFLVFNFTSSSIHLGHCYQNIWKSTIYSRQIFTNVTFWDGDENFRFWGWKVTQSSRSRSWA